MADSLSDEVIDKVKEVIIIAKNADSEFEGGRDEKILKILELSENIPFDFDTIDSNIEIDKEAEFKALEDSEKWSNMGLSIKI